MAKCGNDLYFVVRCFLDTGNGVSELPGRGNDPVRGSDDGDRHGVMFGAKGIGEVFAANVFHDGADAGIVFEKRADVPAIGCVEAP